MDVVVDFCNFGDPVCSGGDVLQEHYRYPEYWDVEAARFVRERL